MHVQLFKVRGLELTASMTHRIDNISPWAGQGGGDSGFNLLIAEISPTHSSDVAVAKVMLSGDLIREHSRAKRALVGNNTHVYSVPEVMSWKLGPDHMVSKVSIVTTSVWASGTINHNFTLEDLGRSVFTRFGGSTIHSAKAMNINGPEL